MDYDRHHRDPLARNLFSNNSASVRKRRPLRKYNRKKVEGPPNPLGLIIFSLILALGIALPAILSDPNHNVINAIDNIISNDLPLFFSSEPMNKTTLWIDFDQQYVKGIAGSFHCSIIVGVIVSALTFLCMYFDSCVPGNFPPTPVKYSPNVPSPGPLPQLAFGYKVVPINGVVGAIVAMFIFRLYLNVPFY